MYIKVSITIIIFFIITIIISVLVKSKMLQRFVAIGLVVFTLLFSLASIYSVHLSKSLAFASTVTETITASEIIRDDDGVATGYKIDGSNKVHNFNLIEGRSVQEIHNSETPNVIYISTNKVIANPFHSFFLTTTELVTSVIITSN